jgi:hypothetical protein
MAIYGSDYIRSVIIYDQLEHAVNIQTATIYDQLEYTVSDNIRTMAIYK